ncbi:hypothetical protein ACWDZ9_35395, partial [Streptomyces sp. NPDC003015]
DDREPTPASGMRADHDDHRTRSDAGWPQHAETEGDATPEGTADVIEEEAPVRKAVDDDTSAAAFTGEDPEDRGPLAPEFHAPTDSDGTE